jgi:hypothetical protein
MLSKQTILHGKRPGFFYAEPGSFSSLSNGLKRPVPFVVPLFSAYFSLQKNRFKNIIKAPD